MANNYFRSDVYYVEQDLSQAIAGVSTSVGAIVGAARRGPTYRRLVTSPEAYKQKYGAPDASISFMGYCALAFLEESNQLWVRRAVGNNALVGGVALQQHQPMTSGDTLGPLMLVPDATPDPDKNGISWGSLAGANIEQDNIVYFYAEGPGSYSTDLSVEIVSDNMSTPANFAAYDAATVGVIITGTDAVGVLPAGTYSYGVSAVNRVGETPVATAVVTLPGQVAAYLTWDKVGGAIGYNVYRLNPVSGNLEYIQTVGASSTFYMDRGLLTLDGTKTPITNQEFTSVFTVNVYDSAQSKSNPVETFRCSLEDYTDASGAQLEIMQQINGVSNYIRVQSNIASFLTAPPIYSVPKQAFGAGDSGDAVTSSDLIKAWDDFADEDAVEVRLLINGGYAIPSVQMKMDAIAHSRQDCMAILDTPSNKQRFDLAVDYRNIDLNLNSNRSALYAQDVYIEDADSGKRLFVPPSGHIAAVYAYTDNTTYPWFAPAGMRRGQLRVLGVRYKYDKGERDSLWKAQVNYIRDFAGIGRVVWEQRTLQVMQSAFSYVNVRRLMDNISIALRRAILFEEFEPNDDFLQLMLKTMLDEYLTVVQQARGIKKFKTVVGAENNSSNDADNGQLNLDMLITPIIPGEKFRLRGTLTRQGASFGELIAAGALS